MGKNKLSMMRNITALRVICLIVSLLFIPTFQYGMVSIWAPVLGMLMALLFDCHLQKIIDSCGPVEDKAKRCKSVLRCYAMLTIEMAAIGSLGAIILLYGGFSLADIAIPLDYTLMDFSPLGLLSGIDYKNAQLEFKILLAVTNSIIVWFLLVFFLVRKKLKICSEFIVFGKSSKEYGGADISKRIKRAGEYEQVIALGMFFTFLPMGYVALLYVNADEMFDIKTAIFVIMGWIIINLAIFINFIANVGIEKN